MSTPTLAATCTPATDRTPAAAFRPARLGRLPIGPLLPVVGGTLAAPTVHGTEVRYANLDYAASAPALQAVADTVTEVLPYYSSVHRGAGYASQVSTALFESARQEVAAFLGAREDDVTVFTRNTTDALNLLASAVPGRTVVLDVEHHANFLPWAQGEHTVVRSGTTVDETLAALGAELRKAPTALLAVTGASNVTGELLPLPRVVALAHAHGARVAIDAAQLAPHRRIDLRTLGADYVALSGHKLYAPFGAGVLVGRRDWLDAAPPHQLGGGAVTAVHADGTAEWAAAPARHEGGTPNVVGAAALAAACRAIAALPAGALEQHETELRERLVAGLTSIPGVRVLRIWSDSGDAVGVVGFTVAGHDPGRVAAYLSAEHGIGVRDGKFCAHPLLARLSTSGGALRASLGLGSRSDDVDRLVTALRTLVQDGEGWDYALDGGRWAPTPDPRPAPGFLSASAGTVGPSSPCEA